MNRLKSLREDRGMTMKECAMRLKMPYTTYVNYEKGAREPNSETLIQIANFFGVSVDFLVGRDTKQSLSCENSSSEIEKKQAEYVALFRKRMDLEAEVERLNKEAERYHKKSRVMEQSICKVTKILADDTNAKLNDAEIQNIAMNYINGFDSDTFFKMLKKWASTATVEKKLSLYWMNTNKQSNSTHAPAPGQARFPSRR